MKEINIHLSGSKSITNRLLLLNKLLNNSIDLKNISHSQDSELMINALNSSEKIIDIHHAGTAMRFLTAFYSIKEGEEIILTGSSRMKERPIKVLVDALKSLGADIKYIENEGFPPLKIIGKKLSKNLVSLPASISSQYITALCLIGCKLENGLSIKLEGKITSFPYINMTLKILSNIGITCFFEKNIISISPLSKIEKQTLTIESDWSSASYHYSICALSKDSKINLKYLFENSLQADKRVVDIYKEYFGVNSIFTKDGVTLTKNNLFSYPKSIGIDMNDCPDIAQTVCITAFGLKIPIRITGLETLKIKETDRLQALKNELEKCGAKVEITSSTIEITPCNEFNINKNIETYNDHRMAMSFTPLKLLFPLNIINPQVVEKSYVEFWDDMAKYNITNS